MAFRRAAPLLALATAALAAACGLDLSGAMSTANLFDAGSGGPPLDASFVGDASDGDDDDAATGTSDAPAGDGALPPDSAPPPPPCNGLRCGTGCLVDASTCVACDAGTLLCASTATCGSDCAACADNPIQCYLCDLSRENPVGSCEPNDAGAYCLNATYGGANLHCNCTTAADCPSPDEVCIAHDPGNIFLMGNACYTCGEADDSHDTNGDMCKSGGSCNRDAAVPSCQ